jgi:phosphoribosylamine--glycine ligase
MEKRVFGAAGETVVVEEVLPGEEMSFHVVTDGHRFHVLPAAQDHKRAYDGDRGPNTGGMGAYAPASLASGRMVETIITRIIEPTLAGLSADGTPFRGVLFAGLMINDGEPVVLEFNVRFGDPEASVLVPLYDGSWNDLLRGAAMGKLPDAPKAAVSQSALSVVMASEGYPAAPVTGAPISGLDQPDLPGSFVLHAGTSLRADGTLVSAGGRVLTVGAVAPTLEEAASRAYAAVDRISFRGEHHRRDIGARAVER